jgi:choloylglycine hydrolase
MTKSTSIFSDDAPSWTSKFGSITFNQYGRDFPQGGMNEAGLVIEILWLNDTVYTDDDHRIPMDPTHWIQYQLDTSASVEEVIESFERVQLQASYTVHFFITDRTGEAASIEFLDGKLVVHRSEENMPATVLTNSTYEESLRFLQGLKDWGGENPLPDSRSSLSRFGRAAVLSRGIRAENRDGVGEVFEVLDAVTQGDHTQWSIVYDLNALRIHFRTHGSRQIKSVDLADVDFACATPMQYVDIDLKGEGDLAGRWGTYTRKVNRDLIERAFKKTSFLQGASSEVIGVFAAYPDRAKCAGQ